MDLKEILGEELYAQVTEAVKGKGKNGKDIELVAANTGDYVPAGKYDELKSSYTKVSNDYTALNSKYESDVSTAKTNSEAMLKRLMLKNELVNKKVTPVNNGYDIYLSQFDLDSMKVENDTIVGLEEAVNTFVTNNPTLIATSKTSTEPATEAKAEPSVPAATGLNPTSSVKSGVKDRAFYEEAYKNTVDFTEKMSIKRQAGEQGIII